MTKKQIIKNVFTVCCIILMSSAAIPMAFAGATADGSDSSTSTTATEPTCDVDPDGDSFNVADCLSVSGQTQSALKTEGDEGPVIQLILNTVVFITKIIGSVAVLILVIAGLLMITSMHKEQQITHAKEMFVAALVGLIITFTAFIIATFVQSLFYT